jgi:hypothetical protein
MRQPDRGDTGGRGAQAKHRFFDAIRWEDERAYLGDLVFAVSTGGPSPPHGDDHFGLAKNVHYYHTYQTVFEAEGIERLDHIFEVGIWDGGSTVIWNECLKPRKLVAIDISRRGDSPYFRRYLAGGAGATVRTFWGVDQRDRQALTRIAFSELGGQIDLVIDDASHFFSATRDTLETLFPLLRPRGLYVIEDWKWKADASVSRHFPPEDPGLIGLVESLVRLSAATTDVIDAVYVMHPLVAIKRGGLPPSQAAEALSQISLRPQLPRTSLPLRARQRLSRLLAPARRRKE